MTDTIDTETDDVGTGTFAFEAGPWAWRDFVTDMGAFANACGIDIAFNCRRSPFWGVFGVAVTYTVTGPAPKLGEFEAFAEHRAQTLAGVGGGGGF